MEIEVVIGRQSKQDWLMDLLWGVRDIKEAMKTHRFWSEPLDEWWRYLPRWGKGRYVWGKHEFSFWHLTFDFLIKEIEWRYQLNTWVWSSEERSGMEITFEDQQCVDTFKEMGLDDNTLKESHSREENQRPCPGSSQHLDPGSRKWSQHRWLGRISQWGRKETTNAK